MSSHAQLPAARELRIDDELEVEENGLPMEVLAKEVKHALHATLRIVRRSVR